MNKNGFTLLGVLIAMVILGFLIGPFTQLILWQNKAKLQLSSVITQANNQQIALNTLLQQIELQNIASWCEQMDNCGDSPRLCLTTTANNKDVDICENNCTFSTENGWILGTKICNKGVMK